MTLNQCHKNVNVTSFRVCDTGMLDLWFLHDETLIFAFYFSSSDL